jgi:hypothetical protein
MRLRRFENKQKCNGSEKMHENRLVWPIAAGNALMQRDGHWAMLKGTGKPLGNAQGYRLSSGQLGNGIAQQLLAKM